MTNHWTSTTAIHFIFGCVLLVGALNCSAQAASSDSKNQIRVIASSQDAEGVTQRDMNLSFLKNFERYSVERIKVKTSEVNKAKGYPDANVGITSEATYVESGKMKLAVLRLKGTDQSSIAIIAGIVGKELKRVSCAKNSMESIPITYGPCSEKIAEIFGVNLGR